MTPRSINIGLVALGLSAGVVVMYAGGRREPATVLNPPPDIPVMADDELARVPDKDLLERVNRECLRRMYAADCAWGDSPRILPARASWVWIITNVEMVILNQGLGGCLRGERDPGQQVLEPTLDQLATAYEGVGLKSLAEVVREAVALSSPDDPAMAQIQARYSKLVGNGTQAQVLAFARAHRGDLFK